GRALQPDQPPVDRVAALAEEGIEREHRGIPRVRRGRRGGDLRHRAFLLPVQHGLEQRLLAGEVVVHGAAGPPARRRHVFQRRRRVAPGGEQRRRLVEQRRPGRVRVQLPAALDRLHALSIVTYTAYVTLNEYGWSP